MNVDFNCPKCKSSLNSYFPDEVDDQCTDNVHCSCGKVWRVFKPVNVTDDYREDSGIKMNINRR